MDYKEGLEKIDRLLDKHYKYKNIDDVYKDLSDIKDLLKTARNELCLQCGKYKGLARAGFDWCSDCRFRSE